MSSLTRLHSTHSSFPISDQYISFSKTIVFVYNHLNVLVASCIAQLPATAGTSFPPMMENAFI